MELKPCPMCNEKLSLVGTSYMHLISDCILSQFHVNPGKFSAWNRRAESDREAVLTHTLELRVQELDATADILEQTRRENADLLAALKDCEARLALLVHSGRSKMLDVRAAEKARAAIARYE